MTDSPGVVAAAWPGHSATAVAGRSGSWGRGRVIAARAALPAALLLWLLSLRQVDLDRMGDLGLIQVLPVLFWVAAALLTLGFALALHERRIGTGWLVGYVLGLIAVIHATPTLLYPTLRYSWAWKHLAVIDAMLRHGGAVPHAQGLDIYNQWPGFFVLNALLLRATGLHSALGYAAWTPPVVNALLLGPLLLLYRSVTQDRRIIWGAAWIYYACSWVGQDYFSPQAFAFLLYAVVLALVFRRLADPPDDRRGRLRGLGWPPGRLVLVLVVEAAIVTSHQLTPLMLVTVLALLSLPRANRRVTLVPLLGAVVMTLAWAATVARPYISANLRSFGQALLAPDGNAVSGLAGLGASAPGQVLVAWIDRGLSAAVVLLALVAFLRCRWVRRTGIPLAAVSPLPLLIANSYGGEMIFRVYLFALPATAFLVAALVLGQGSRLRLRAGVSVLLMAALLAGLFFAYYSKEKMNYFTPDEVAAAEYATDTAPPQSVIVAVTGNVPAFYAHYDQHLLIQLVQESPQLKALLLDDPLAALRTAVAGTGQGAPVYLILSRAQEAENYLTGNLPADTTERLRAAVESAPGFTVVYRNADAVVYRFVATPTAQTGVAP